jgi:hypothetical protein
MSRSWAAESKLARVGPTIPKRATARGASDRQEPLEAGSCQPAIMYAITLAGTLPHSIEMGNQIPAGWALQWDQTKDETP